MQLKMEGCSMFDVPWPCSNCTCKGIQYLLCLGPAQMFSSQSSRLKKRRAMLARVMGDKKTELPSYGVRDK
jgi:hypothetical protein